MCYQRDSGRREGGKAGTRRRRKGGAPNPRAEYLLCNSTIALYSELVMPHALATLVTSTTLLFHSDILRAFPSMSVATSSANDVLSVILALAQTWPMPGRYLRAGLDQSPEHRVGPS